MSVSVYFNRLNFHGKDGNGYSVGTVAGIVVGAVCLIVLILGGLRSLGYLRRRDTNELGIYVTSWYSRGGKMAGLGNETKQVFVYSSKQVGLT